jgi:tRNA G18 (ribose-2'-O)-methylase SpoU
MDDPRLDDYRNLNDTTLRRRLEVEGGFFMVEGWEAVRQLLASDWSIRSVLVARGKEERLTVTGTPVWVLPPPVIEEVVGFDLHRGVIASVERRPDPGLAAILNRRRTIAILEGITDPENLGAIFRSAAALGVEAIVLDPSCEDPYYRRVVRVSMGGVLLVPFTRLPSWPQGLEHPRREGFRIVAMTPDRAAAGIDSVGPGVRTAILLGSESGGLTTAVRRLADIEVRIPQHGPLDSLNVGHAAAIAFHHFAANRRTG